MTREEAIICKIYLEDLDEFHTCNEYKLLIGLLDREPCEDAISRQAAISDIQEMAEWHTEDAFNADRVIQHLKDLPPVTPQPKTGYWIIKDGKEQGYDIGGVKTWYIQIMCSECGFIKTAIEGHTGQYRYCPNCGACMKDCRTLDEFIEDSKESEG